MKNILITGGTGLLGTNLGKLLIGKGYQVSFLSRKKEVKENIDIFKWDIDKKTIEAEALEKADAIIHLAGAGVADKTWTDKRKKEIMDSRVKSTELLFNELSKINKKPTCFISASAIGYYGLDTGDKILDEQSKPGKDFLAEVCVEWEKSVDLIATLGIRTSKVRIGVVLSNEGGAFPKIAQPIRLGAGAGLGTGKQFMSWIHWEDLCNVFVHILENHNLEGVFNGVAPNPVDNLTFTQITAKVLHKPLLLPNIPAFVLKLMLGEMANIALGGNKVSSQKIQSTGFQFKYKELEEAIKSLIPKE